MINRAQHKKNSEIVRKIWSKMFSDRSRHGMKMHEMAIDILRARGESTKGLMKRQLIAAAAGTLPAAKEKKSKKKKPKRDNFYKSWEWKAVRYEALKLHGYRCQCCGWRPGDTDRGYLVVDHIKPRRKHPESELTLSNLQVLCNDCNMGKSNQFEDDFRDIHRATIN